MTKKPVKVVTSFDELLDALQISVGFSSRETDNGERWGFTVFNSTGTDTPSDDDYRASMLSQGSKYGAEDEVLKEFDRLRAAGECVENAVFDALNEKLCLEPEKDQEYADDIVRPMSHTIH